MKRYIYLFLMLLLFWSGSIKGQTYGLTLQTLPAGIGSVSGGGMYAAGANVNVRTSSNNSSFKFKSWNEDNTVVSTVANFTYVMPNRSCILTAVYEYDPNNPSEPNALYKLNLQISPAGAGSVSGAGAYAAGSVQQIKANNNTGFKFLEWREGETTVSTNATFNYTVPARDVALTAYFTYDPGNPGEPVTPNIKKKSALFVEAKPATGGSFNITSGTKYEEGQSVYLYAYNNTGFKFVEWRDGETVISTVRNFYYTMPGNDKKLTAIYNYDPDNPSDPGTPANIDHGLIALTQYGDGGQNMLFPVYLLNSNISVHSVDFDIAFPANVTVDYAHAILSARVNGHTVTATASGSNSFHYSIQGSADFSGSNGILVSIPLTLPVTWTSDVTYPVSITNVVLGTAAGTVNSSAKPGALGVKQTADNSVKANFYSNLFLNRVSFINLSTETATDFAWNFGDGTTSAEKDPLHVFASGGTYNVRLIASNASRKDTVTIPVEISPASAWMLSGTLSLNKHKQDLKNFTSVKELFLLLSQANITGDVTVNVEAGETFDWTLSSGEESQFTLINEKLSAGNTKLIFQKEGTAGNPVIQFSGALSVQGYSALIRLGRWIKTNQVEIKILGQTVDLQRIYSYLPQRVCSGTKSGQVDFSEISGALSYNWELIVSPASITGYTVSGVNRIPEMTLANTSTKSDSLRYKVSIMYTPPASQAVELYSWEYRITVLPLLQGELKLLAPANNAVLSNSTVSLSWTAITNAVYDLYIYEEYYEEPATATVSQIQGTTYQSSALFQYGKTYRCKVVARNECSRIESETITFTVRQLPNLHVTSIGFPENVEAGSEIEIGYRIKNDGLGATLASEHWNERVGIVQNMQNPASIFWLTEKGNKSPLDAGGSYSDTVKVTLPERLTGTAYIIVTCNMDNILSIDWSPVNNTVPVPYTPSASRIPYPYLKAQTNITARMPEDGETNTITDNFFYAQIGINLQKLPDLKVTAIEIPASAVETSTFTVKATIGNTGEAAVEGKTWSDGIYASKTADFNLATASLVAVAVANHRLAPGESYQAVFSVTAPVDSLVNNYYFVSADVNDEVYESNEGNNRLVSNPILILPYMMDANDYLLLKSIYNESGGDQWKTKWTISSSRIGSYWPGVSFENGRVTGISLPSNGLTGVLTGDYLKFPYLTGLNLYDNRLTGSLTALLAGTNLPGSLTAMNLGKNQLTGSIPATISKLTGLTNLDLSYNRLTDLEAALPAKITGLNLQYQTLAKDSIVLSKSPLLNVPTIARYDHAGGNFNAYPSYSLYASNLRLFGYVPATANQYKWDISSVNERNYVWKYDSGIEFTLVQETGLAKGSSCAFKLLFDSGDANIDQSVNILDVQHTLNYIFKEQVSAFNFAASDTYKDNMITVQDIIKTINILFNINKSPALSLRSKVETNNTLSIENGKLVLVTEEAIAAMDIRLDGVLEKDVSSLLDDSKFQFVFNDSGTGTHLILVSFTRDALPPGRTAIAGINSNNATIVEVTASDPDAQPVPIRISSGEMKIIPVETESIRIYANKDVVYFDLPRKADEVVAVLYTLQGTMVGKQQMIDVPQGKHSLYFNLNDYPNDYILNISVKTGSQNISKTIKLLLKK